MYREKNFLKNVFVLGFGNFLSRALHIITLPIITLYLTKNEYGLFEFISTLVLLCTPIVTVQIHSATFRFLIDTNMDDNKKVSEIITNTFMFILPIAIISSIILYFMLCDFRLEYKIIISLYLIFDVIYNCLIQVCCGLHKEKVYSFSTIVMSFTYMIGIVLAVKLSQLGLLGVLLILVISNFISIIYIIKKLNIFNYINISLVSKKKIKDMLLYSWPMVFNNLSVFVLSMSDRIVVTSILGLEANAEYAVANKIPQLLLIVQQIVIVAWHNNAASAAKDKDACEYYTKMFNAAFSLLIGVTALLLSFSPLLFSILIKGNYDNAFMQLPILIIGVFFSTMSSFLSGLYLAYRKTKSIASTTVLAGIVNLVIDVVLINKIGIYAASISTLVAYLFIYIIRMTKLRNIQKINYNIKRQLLCIPVIIIMAILLALRNNIINIINCFVGLTFFVIINNNLIKKILQQIKLRNKH